MPQTNGQTTSGPRVETLGPQNVAAAVARTIEAGLTPFIHSMPGMGKSAIVEAIARSARVECRTLSLSLMQPEDLRVPVPGPNGVAWHYADALPRNGRGILFLDEFPQAHESVQACFGQLLHLGRIDQYILPSGWAVVCAGNRVEDMAAAHAVPTQIRNRVVHLHLNTTILDWTAYNPDDPLRVTVQKWPERRMTDHAPHPLLVAMAQVRPDALTTPNNWRDLDAWPTPRTLSLASGYLAWRGDAHLDDVDWAVIAGLVGAPLAAEIRTYSELRSEIPTEEAILNGTASVPKDLAARWVVAIMAADRAAQKKDRKLVDATFRYLDEFPLNILTVSGARICKALCSRLDSSALDWPSVVAFLDKMRENKVTTY